MTTEISKRLLKRIREFNRKERYHLLTNAMGGEFSLNEDFASKLSKAIKQGDESPPTKNELASDATYVAMDYHLDWLAAAVQSICDPNSDKPIGERIGNTLDDGFQVLRGNQEDIDLLVVTKHKEKVWIILVEAKFDTGWSTKQLASKIRRLNWIVKMSQGAIVPRLVAAEWRDYEIEELREFSWEKSKDQKYFLEFEKEWKSENDQLWMSEIVDFPRKMIRLPSIPLDILKSHPSLLQPTRCKEDGKPPKSQTKGKKPDNSQYTHWKMVNKNASTQGSNEKNK